MDPSASASVGSGPSSVPALLAMLAAQRASTASNNSNNTSNNNAEAAAAAAASVGTNNPGNPQPAAPGYPMGMAMMMPPPPPPPPVGMMMGLPHHGAHASQPGYMMMKPAAMQHQQLAPAAPSVDILAMLHAGSASASAGGTGAGGARSVSSSASSGPGTPAKTADVTASLLASLTPGGGGAASAASVLGSPAGPAGASKVAGLRLRKGDVLLAGTDPALAPAPVSLQTLSQFQADTAYHTGRRIAAKNGCVCYFVKPGFIRVLQVASTRRELLRGLEGISVDMQFHASGQQLAVVDSGGSVMVWGIWSSPDNLSVSCIAQGSVRNLVVPGISPTHRVLWRAASNSLLIAAGTCLATANVPPPSADGSPQLLSFASAWAHTAPISDLCIIPSISGSIIGCACDDGTVVLLRDRGTGAPMQPIATLCRPGAGSAPVNSIRTVASFPTAGFSVLVSGSARNTELCLWVVPHNAPESAHCSQALRLLTGVDGTPCTNLIEVSEDGQFLFVSDVSSSCMFVVHMQNDCGQYWFDYVTQHHAGAPILSFAIVPAGDGASATSTDVFVVQATKIQKAKLNHADLCPVPGTSDPSCETTADTSMDVLQSFMHATAQPSPSHAHHVPPPPTFQGWGTAAAPPPLPVPATAAPAPVVPSPSPTIIPMPSPTPSSAAPAASALPAPPPMAPVASPAAASAMLLSPFALTSGSGASASNAARPISSPTAGTTRAEARGPILPGGAAAVPVSPPVGTATGALTPFSVAALRTQSLSAHDSSDATALVPAAGVSLADVQNIVDGGITRLLQVLEEQRVKREEAEHARQEQLMNSMNRLLNEDIPRLVASNAVASVKAELLPDMRKLLGDFARNELKQTLELVLTQKLLPRVNETVEMALSASGEMSSAIAESVSSSLKDQLGEAFISSFTDSVVPAFESATVTMFSQISNTLENGLQRMYGQDAGAGAGAGVGAGQAIQQPGAALVEESVAAPIMPQPVAPSVPVTAESQQGMLSEAAIAAAVGPTEDDLQAYAEQTAAPQPVMPDPVTDIQAAFEVALNANNIYAVEEICKAAGDPSVAVKTLSDLVLLCLVQQLSTSLSSEPLLKLQWLASTIPQLDRSNPLIAQHLPSIAQGLRNALLEHGRFLNDGPTAPWYKKVASGLRQVM